MRTEIGPLRRSELASVHRLAELVSHRHGYPMWEVSELERFLRSRECRLLGARSGADLTGVVGFERLPWDSGLLGTLLGRVSLLATSREGDESAAGRLLERVRDEAGALGWEAVWLRIAGTHREGIRAAERGRAQLMGTLNTLRFNLDGGERPGAAGGGIAVRAACGDDVGRLRELASGAFTRDRYHRDPTLLPERVGALWAESVENALHGRAREVLVGEIRGEVEGFVTLHLEENLSGRPSPGTGVIGLVAVSGAAVRRGLGKRLVGAALRWFADTSCDAVEVGTQGDNLPALNLYVGAGFRMHRVWLDYRLKLGKKKPGRGRKRTEGS